MSGAFARRPGARVPTLPMALGFALLVSLAGCAARPVVAPPVTRPAPPVAATPVPPPIPPVEPQGGTPVGTTASGGVITTHQVSPPIPAVVDSAPSEDALAVLRTIPEPLGDRGNPDSLRVPVPSPTQPLGEREGTRATAALPESLAAPPALPPSTATPRDVAAPATVSPDSCWRVQVLAPPERERADRMAEAARSQLLIPFVVEREGGLFKVRSRDCMSAGAASDLRRRAEQSGFTGAFRFQVRPR